MTEIFKVMVLFLVIAYQNHGVILGRSLSKPYMVLFLVVAYQNHIWF